MNTQKTHSEVINQGAKELKIKPEEALKLNTLTFTSQKWIPVISWRNEGFFDGSCT
jgi:hypothetical protein